MDKNETPAKKLIPVDKGKKDIILYIASIFQKITSYRFTIIKFVGELY